MRKFQQNCQKSEEEKKVKLWRKGNMATWWLCLPKKKDKSDSCTNLLFAKSLPDPASCDKWSVLVVICGLGWNCDATYVRLQDIGLWITNRTRLCFALSGRGDKSVGNVKLCKSRNMWQLRWRWAACEWVAQLWRRDPRERLPDLTSDWMMAEGLARNKVINKEKDYDFHGNDNDDHY